MIFGWEKSSYMLLIKMESHEIIKTENYISFYYFMAVIYYSGP